MSNEPKRWLSPVPGFCETCDGPISSIFYDAATKSPIKYNPPRLGPWACMCKTCFTLGPGFGKLGQGYGQEYTFDKATGFWLKTGG